MDVKRVQMFITPVESDLQHRVEVRQGRVTTHEQTAPDERTDLSQDDTQLIDGRRFYWLAHRVSVAQCVVSLKVSPRNLALSALPWTMPHKRPCTTWSA